MRHTTKSRVPVWVLPVALLLVAGSAFALLRGTTNGPVTAKFAQASASGTSRQARTARGTSAVLPAPKGWSSER
ncbi:MAG: hypothetical protein HZB16_01700 [Armatimonadetes bacterium]|nr:hypothetical protein [Armatimonadota bacterium]